LNVVYETVTNPREMIWNKLKFIATDYVWVYVSNYFWQIATVLLMKVAAFKMYQYITRNSIAEQTFSEVRMRLQTVFHSKMYENGYDLDELVHNYSRKYNYSEQEFRDKILPLMRILRRRDPYLKEDIIEVNGMEKFSWYWKQ
jgi:hypothetical protein